MMAAVSCPLREPELRAHFPQPAAGSVQFPGPRLRVVLVAPCEQHGYGGGQAKAGRYLIERLGPEIDVCHIKIPHEAENTRFRRLLVSAGLLARAVKASGGKGACVVHIFSPCNRSGFYEKLLHPTVLRLLGRKTIFNFRNAFDKWYTQWSAVERALILKLLPLNTLVLCQYRGLQRFLIERRLVRNWRSAAVIPNGIETGELGGLPGRAFTESTVGILRIVSLAGLYHRKGIDILVKAAGLLRRNRLRKDFRIDVYGWEREKGATAAYQKLATSENLLEMVAFHEPVFDEEKRRILAAADIFVYPSRAEGFPNALLEAMLAGLPVVASDVGAVPEMLAHGVTGLVFRSEDAEALAANLERLINDADLRCAMGRAARSRAMEAYGLASVIEMHKQLYSAVAHARR
jgi:glycosyltransferase involved in cell wall biosynthesis